MWAKLARLECTKRPKQWTNKKKKHTHTLFVLIVLICEHNFLHLFGTGMESYERQWSSSLAGYHRFYHLNIIIIVHLHIFLFSYINTQVNILFSTKKHNEAQGWFECGWRIYRSLQSKYVLLCAFRLVRWLVSVVATATACGCQKWDYLTVHALFVHQKLSLPQSIGIATSAIAVLPLLLMETKTKLCSSWMHPKIELSIGCFYSTHLSHSTVVSL